MAALSLKNIGYTTITCIAFLCLFENDQVSGFECGTVKLVRSLTIGGKLTLKNEWPFIAALYKLRPSNYICGGTLISDRHVLTAAHCIHKRDSSVKLSHNDIAVRLGAYNLQAEKEIGSVERNVTEIFVHPDWNPYDKYDADIAILVLSENVTFSNYIQPVCLPANDVVINSDTINVKGRIVGWGTGENVFSEAIPRQIEAEASNNSYCYRTDPGIISYSSNRSFCAKSAEGTPIQGDSGGGFFVASVSVWVQYGIVSAIRTNDIGRPTYNSFAIYTNVQSFKHWIVNVVKQSGGEVGESTIKVNLECIYVDFEVYGYGCHLNGVDIRNEHTEIDLIFGSHISGKGANDVEAINFNSGYMLTIPDGLGKVFKNLKHLKVGRHNSMSTGLRYVRRSSLKNLEKLLRLQLGDNDIETLDEDCLWDLPNLVYFTLVSNKLRVLHEKSFDRNEQLEEIILPGNRLETLPKHLFKNNLSLKLIDLSNNLLRTIDDELFETNLKLGQVYLSSNKLNALPKRLFEHTTLLETIKLDNNFLKSIDDKVFETNVNLRHVELNSNQLDSLPANLFENNVLLMDVQLYGNFIKTIDENIFKTNSKLAALSFAYNPIGILPRNLFKNKSLLRVILLSNISLATIDEHIFATNTKLGAVDLQFNQLEHLPSNLFKTNTLLDFLILKNNLLKTIDEQIFQMNLKLRQVDLSSNQLTDLPVKLFRNNLLLETLNMESNLLKSIDENIFESNVKLREVRLSSNKLEYLPKNLFKNHSALQFILLANNLLKTIDINFTELKSVKGISLYENICFNAVYTTDDSRPFRNQFRNLTEFQGLLNTNCSSTKNLIS